MIREIHENEPQGPSCHVCGAVMQKAEKGWKCQSCGAVTVPSDPPMTTDVLEQKARVKLREAWVVHLASLGDAATACQCCESVRPDLQNEFIVNTLTAFAREIVEECAKMPRKNT